MATKASDLPSGLVGISPREPVGVHINMSVAGPNGAPCMGGRFWMMEEPTESRRFKGGSGREFSRLTREPHPRFAAWNEAARRLGDEIGAGGAGRVGMLRGCIVHASVPEAARWNRSAQKLPAPHPNPSLTRNAACEGNGIWARRFVKVEAGEERFERIACPNELCVFAQSRLCKPDTSLFFKLRFDQADPWEAQFPELLAHWHTGGWESTAGLMGLFEYVVGTAGLLSPELRAQATAEERAAWRPGFAAGLGLAEVNLIGMPFVMSIHYRTKAASEGSPAGKRFPVVAFSPDGDLEAWLLAQHRQRRELAQGLPPVVKLLPASVQDQDFLEVGRHDARIETAGLPVDDGPAADLAVPEAVSEPAVLSGAEKQALWQWTRAQLGGGAEAALKEILARLGVAPGGAVPAGLRPEIELQVTAAAKAKADQPVGRKLSPEQVAELEKLIRSAGLDVAQIEGRFGGRLADLEMNELDARGLYSAIEKDVRSLAKKKGGAK